MRNWFDNGCDCGSPDPIVGAIIGGKKFPFGTVKQADYDADMEEIQSGMNEINSALTNMSAQRTADLATLNNSIGDVDEKANAVNAAMIQKTAENRNDITSLNSEVVVINAKVDANKSISDAALATKANTTDVNVALNTKANAAEVNAALEAKANASEVSSALSAKVDKVTGKGLSQNDYSDSEKQKVSAATSDIATLKSYFTTINE